MPVLINRLFHRSLRGIRVAKSQKERTDVNPDEEQEEQDDDSSLLSEPEWRDYWNKPEYSTLGYFQHRERLLRRILRDNPLADQIRRRERAVRLLHYQCHVPRRIKAKRHMVMTELLIKNEEKVSYWKDFWIFEWHSSIPAACCLLIHCVAHSALDDFVRTFIGSGLFATVCGILLLRLSGDLYWWLDDDRYDALRVDFENRRRLGYDIEMEWIRQIRRRPIVRAICFMIGYPICYMASVAISENIERFFFDEYDYIVSNLPSALQDEKNGTCPAPVSFCSTACQTFLKERETTASTQAQADLIFTWKVLSAEGYDSFWFASIDDSSTPAITSSTTHFLYSTATIALAIISYWLSIRGKFWEKY